MKLEFLACDSPSLNQNQITDALRIAKDAFSNGDDGSLIEISDVNVQWTIKNHGYSWIIILANGKCIGSVAILSTNETSMHKFLAGEITESDLLEIVKHPDSEFDNLSCLYLSGVSIVPEFQRRTIGTQALVFAIENAKQFLPRLKNVFAWPFSSGGEALLPHVEAVCNLSIKIRKF